MIKKLILLSSIFSSLAFGGTITIAVAANVSYAIESLIQEFNKTNPDTKVRVILGSSGKLTAQIKHRAPYQLFMSANMKYPNSLYKYNIAVTKPVVYAQGSLALLSIKNHDFSRGLSLLKDKKIKKIAVANPKTAPYGKATFEALKNSNILDDIKYKFIFGESISSTIAYTVTATDIGVVAASSLFSPKMAKFKKGINWAKVDSSLYSPIDQGIVMIDETKEVRAFYDFILSQRAKKIFKDFGYAIP